MIRKNLFSVICGILVWTLGVSFYLLSFYVPILENSELQSNIVLALGIIPSACLGTYLFYTKSQLKPSKLGLTFVIVATLLDVIITVPVFIIPTGGSYSEFFGDPMFYTIIVEFYFIVLYYGNHLTSKKIKA
ncbi:DUF5367 family protein [Winogradskyella echinorum]|uniref:DUF5367 family protein n=1 Tax=Winogradskyella echinorum TaxID=538189 RepID=A0ABR6Y2K8_9FLAO|nr:DUF5367 family protein [Winogradskyella echinorum]MBC3846984.1 DUF5367 family protein [Winogradskyella echinorum]MBC5751332.1 DUF5367 family protein [Winogradskyella echinorum]